MRNNKGQVGQIMTSVPVLILVFVMMVILVILSGVLGKVRGDVDRAVELGFDKEFLFRALVIENRGMLVFEAIADYWQDYENGEKLDALKKGLEGLMHESDKCLVLIQGFDLRNDVDTNDVYFKNDGEFGLFKGDGAAVKDAEVFYKEQEIMSYFSFLIRNNERVYVEYYYGGCL
jgi:hypothetical protein